ncbi:hypothetical protein Tco_0333267 [Tanacetum coccineum]
MTPCPYLLIMSLVGLAGVGLAAYPPVGYGSNLLFRIAYCFYCLNGVYVLQNIRRIQWNQYGDNTFNGMDEGDVIDHIAKVIELTEWIKILNVEINELRIHIFSKSLKGYAQTWWNSEINETTITWSELNDKFFHKFYPLSHTYNSKILDDLSNGEDYFEFIYWLASKFNNHWEIDRNTKNGLWEFYVNERTHGRIGDLNECKEPCKKTCSDAFYEPYLDAQEANDIYEVIDSGYPPIPILAPYDINNPEELCRTKEFTIIHHSIGNDEEFSTDLAVNEIDFNVCANEIDEKIPELKDLPSHLEYAYLNEDRTCPVIISSKLTKKEKASLLQVLEKHKGAIAWKMSDIKGISPSFCTHKILLEENFKPVIQPQRHLNPKVQEVVKNEIVKLLNSGLIYPILDSPWVSPIHVVLKKGGMTFVLNDNNEPIPSRTVPGWRVCIDYRKLNDATRKDHFPLPFIDQMLERLSGNEFYCFLDGFLWILSNSYCS